MELEAETAALAAAVSRLQAIERRQAAILAEAGAAGDDMRSREAAGAGVVAAEAAQLSRFRAEARRRWAEAEREKERARQAVEQQRQRLLEARRSFEVLDRCREKARSRWIAEFHREQDALAADLFLAKWKPE